MKHSHQNKNYQLLTEIINVLLGCDLGRDEDEQLAVKINSSMNLAETAEIHGVAPLLYQFIKEQQLEILPELKRQIQSLAVRHRFAAQAREKILAEVTRSFDLNDIRFVLLKGAALANMVYTKPEFRPMRDIDILVSKSQQWSVKEILEQLCFEFDESYASIYMGDIHHLPNAIRNIDGLKISLEVHHEIYSRDVQGSQHFEQIIDNAQPVQINGEINALTLDHVAMLNHLCRHTFSLSPEVRLIHQYDILKYAETYFDKIPWQNLKEQNHFIINTIRCLQYSLYLPEKLNSVLDELKVKEMKGIGEAMLPYTHIPLKSKSICECLSAAFSPSPWWMHVNYNIAPEKSLIWCYLFMHPKRVFKDIALRLFYAAKNSLRKTK